MREVTLRLEVLFTCEYDKFRWSRACYLAEIYGAEGGLFKDREQAEECANYLTRNGFVAIINEAEVLPQTTESNNHA